MKLYTRPFLKDDFEGVEHWADFNWTHQKYLYILKEDDDFNYDEHNYKIISQKIIRTPPTPQKFYYEKNNFKYGNFGHDVLELIIEFENVGNLVAAIMINNEDRIFFRRYFKPNIFIPGKLFKIYLDTSLIPLKKFYAPYKIENVDDWEENYRPFNNVKRLLEYVANLEIVPHYFNQLKIWHANNYNDNMHFNKDETITNQQNPNPTQPISNTPETPITNEPTIEPNNEELLFEEHDRGVIDPNTKTPIFNNLSDKVKWFIQTYPNFRDMGMTILALWTQHFSEEELKRFTEPEISALWKGEPVG